MGCALLASRRLRLTAVLAAAALLVLAAGPALANVPLTQVSSDPFTTSHQPAPPRSSPTPSPSATPIVSAFQVGRFFDGGGSAIGCHLHQRRRHLDRGSCPASPSSRRRIFDRASDPAVAYDPRTTSG